MPAKLDAIIDIVADVPDYQAFLSVDELAASTRRLASTYPGIVHTVFSGYSRRGYPIETIRIGSGSKRAFLFAMSHPNEPIGSMTLEYLTSRLAQDTSLREALGYTWYFIKCADPDGTLLNEGWLKEPFSIKNYARHYYRPPLSQQVEWTFSIDYKTLHFHDPRPETKVLMTLIEQVRPDLMYSLHNSDLGGVYFYVSEKAPVLYRSLHELVEYYSLPLHLSGPPIPFVVQHADAVFQLPTTAQAYDYFENMTHTDPALILQGGAASYDYVRMFCDPFCMTCEVPHFYDAVLHDESVLDMTHRGVVLESLKRSKEELEFLKKQYNLVKEELAVPSPFRAALDENLDTYFQRLTAQEKRLKTDTDMNRLVTKAERFDILILQKFHRLLNFGIFIRMIEAQITATGNSPVLASVHETAEETFDAYASCLENELDLLVIDIQRLVRVQLASILIAAGYAAERKGEYEI